MVQPAFRLEQLVSTIDTLDPDDPFIVRAGSGGFTATVANSEAAVGQLVTTTNTGQSVTVTIPENTSISPTTVANGGAAFDPLGVGSTIVEATIPGFITTDAGEVTVNVAP